MDPDIPLYLIAGFFGYLLGSIPFGLVLVKMAGMGDIRSVGSGNIGATNVLRTGRKDLALTTLVLDASKAGFACVLFTYFSGTTAGLIAGGAAFLGHCFPVWLGFKGGKGVATFFGTLIAASWPVGLMAGATWIIMAAIFRMSSLSALIAAILAPIFTYMMGRTDVAILAVFLAILILWRHQANIQRILKGDEPRIGQKKT